MTTIASVLEAKVATAAPIVGVSLGRLYDKATWRIDFKSDATQEQRDAAQTILAAFDPDAPRSADFQLALQSLVDQTARAKGYNDGASIAGYVNSTIPLWALEAAAFIAWRDTVWVYAHAQFAAVENGEREQPTIVALIAELPAITWPA